VPTVTEGKVEDVIVSSVGATTIVADADTDCAGLLLSLTVAVKVEAPLAVGVPEITPVDDAKVRPAGRLPEEIDQV
jgi:hypothetical protein